MARVYAHTDYVLRGYTRLTHEAVIFRNGQIQEVSGEVAGFLVNQHPLQFCIVPVGQKAEEHHCWLNARGLASSLQPSTYPTTEMEEPAAHREMLATRKRGRPPLAKAGRR